MTVSEVEQQDNAQLVDCLMCAVKGLTVGTPPIWTPTMAGQSVYGAVLATGETSTALTSLSKVPHVDLWLGGAKRIRVIGWAATLRAAIKSAEPEVGDTLYVRYDGLDESDLPGWAPGKQIQRYKVRVHRGHHGE